MNVFYHLPMKPVSSLHLDGLHRDGFVSNGLFSVCAVKEAALQAAVHIINEIFRNCCRQLGVASHFLRGICEELYSS